MNEMSCFLDIAPAIFQLCSCHYYQTSIEVLSVFEEIKKQYGTTIMMITHNPEIAKMADRVIKLRDGRVSSIKVNLHPLRAAELAW